MTPSRKIFIGSSAVVTGILLQFIVGLIVARTSDAVTSASGIAESVGSSDAALEQAHIHLGLSFVGYSLSILALISGLILVLIGTYQTARTVERIQSQRTQ